MGFLIIPIALIAGWLLDYPVTVIAAAIAAACVARFAWETVRDWWEVWS